jgi:hypothetical protein
MNLQQWLIQQNRDFVGADIAGIIGTELHHFHTASLALDKLFDNCVLWEAGFSRKQILISLEVWSTRNLIDFHEWLRKQPTDINSFWLVVIGQPGMAQWWNDYKHLWRIESFHIQEVLDLPFGPKAVQPYARQDLSPLWGRQCWYQDFSVILPDFDRQISHHAVYMAGRSACTIDQGHCKDYLAYCMTELAPDIKMDLCYDPVSVTMLADWLDHEHYYRDASIRDRVSALASKLDQYPRSHAPTQDIFSATIPLYQQSFATVVRESLLAQPWGCVGEKTLRAFYFGQYVIPTTYSSGDYLQQLGFQFDDDIINLEYTRLREPLKRLDGLMSELKKFQQRWRTQDLQQHLAHRRDLYLHNSQLAQNLTQLQSA